MSARTAVKSVCGAILLSVVVGASPASASARVYVRVGPPAPIVEVRAVSPGPKYVWIDGYHRWTGHAYVWVPGRWVVPPHAHAVWVPARWVHDKHGWYVVNGHWHRR
jgi:hypothetical protein